MQAVITAGGNALADLLDFCKFVQTFLLLPPTTMSLRNQLIREIVLSFVHVSSAYVHLGSVILIAEQSGMAQGELENLKASLSLWETVATSIVVSLRALIHTLTDIKCPEHKNRMHDTDDQTPFKHDPFYHSELPFLKNQFGEGGFRFPNASRNQHRPDFFMGHQQYEFKRKYQSANSNSQKDGASSYSNSNTANYKEGCLNFRVKSCNQQSMQNLNDNGVANKLPKVYEQPCSSPDSDSDKSKLSDNQEIKNFSFNLLNPEKKKTKGRITNDQEKYSLSGNRKTDLERPCSTSSSRGSKDESKEKCDEFVRNGVKQFGSDSDQNAASQSLDGIPIGYLPYLNQSKIENWSFGVLNTGDKKTFQSASAKESKVETKQNNTFNETVASQNKTDLDAAEKPMSSDGEGSVTGRFSYTELNKALEEHCEAARIQLKHKMLDILGFLQTPETQNDTSDQVKLLFNNEIIN